jgi:hypothetical protein
MPLHAGRIGQLWQIGRPRFGVVETLMSAPMFRKNKKERAFWQWFEKNEE